MPKMLWVLILAASLHLPAAAQRSDVNYDEDKVPSYILPDPLRMHSGLVVRDADTWMRRRRPEILRLFETYMYGRSPARPKTVPFEVLSEEAALGGKAVRKQVAVYFSGKKEGPKMQLLLYVPADAPKPAPAFLGLNFGGNHTVHADPGIRLGEIWVRPDPKKPAMEKRPARPDSRGSASEAWQVEKILARGYALATIYTGDIEPDFPGGIEHGFRTLYYTAGQSPAPDEWGTIAAWAWGLSRALDYLENDPAVDAKRVAVIGHSRLGKTALWAAAQDQRFAMCFSIQSGEGGAAISRRKFGERVRNLNTSFPHWFCGNYKTFNDLEDELPVDSHMLIALIAPRPVYVSSAEDDRWADPRGEYLALVHAEPVYHLFGRSMPSSMGYHIRPGKHSVIAYDWDQYLPFADRWLKAAGGAAE